MRLLTVVGLCAACFVPLAGAAEEDPLVQMVVDLVKDDDAEMRGVGFEQVRTQAPGEAATLAFAALLPELRPDAQAGLLAALGERGDKVARPAALQMLKGDHPVEVKVAAAGALSKLGSADDVPRLVELLAEEDAALAAAARQSLQRLLGEAVNAQIVRIWQEKEVSDETAVSLMELLAARRAFDAMPALLDAAVSDSAAIRRAAMQALSDLAGPEQLPGMIQGALKAEPGREREAAEKAIAAVCERVDDPNARAAPLIKAIAAAPAESRLALIPLLGRVGGPQARAVVELALRAPAAPFQDQAVSALCNWPDASVAPRILQLAKNHPDKGQRIAALRAVMRIAVLSDERTDEARLELLKKAMRLATRDEDRKLAIDRARAVRTLASLNFVMERLDESALTEAVCWTIVELAHHRELRNSDEARFHEALDKVLAVSKDPITRERATKYKKGETWSGKDR